MPSNTPAQVVQTLRERLALDEWPNPEIAVWGSQRAGTDPRSRLHVHTHCDAFRGKVPIYYRFHLSEIHSRVCSTCLRVPRDLPEAQGIALGRAHSAVVCVETLATAVELGADTSDALRKAVAAIGRVPEGEAVPRHAHQAFSEALAQLSGATDAVEEAPAALAFAAARVLTRKTEHFGVRGKEPPQTQVHSPAVHKAELLEAWETFQRSLGNGELPRDAAMTFPMAGKRPPSVNELAEVVVHVGEDTHAVTFTEVLAQWRLDYTAQLREQMQAWVQLVESDMALAADLPAVHVRVPAHSQRTGPYPVARMHGDQPVLLTPLLVALSFEWAGEGEIVAGGVVSEGHLDLVNSLTSNGQRPLEAWWTVFAAAHR